MVIASDANIFYEESSEITFCVRLMLFTENIEVNYLESVIVLYVDLADGFEIGAVQAKPKKRLEKIATMAGEVDGRYLCNLQNKRIPQEMASDAIIFNQGVPIRVCVTPTQETKNKGLRMRTRLSFIFFRADNGEIRQLAIHEGSAALNGLTDLVCEPDMCFFETVLNVMLYRTTGEVRGSGIALLQFGSENAQLSGDTWTPFRGEFSDLLQTRAQQEPTYLQKRGCVRRERRRRLQRSLQEKEEVTLDRYWNMSYTECALLSKVIPLRTHL
jgi:hypothetical protein